jgi:hypothetical protein
MATSSSKNSTRPKPRLKRVPTFMFLIDMRCTPFVKKIHKLYAYNFV